MACTAGALVVITVKGVSHYLPLPQAFFEVQSDTYFHLQDDTKFYSKLYTVLLVQSDTYGRQSVGETGD